MTGHADSTQAMTQNDTSAYFECSDAQPNGCVEWTVFVLDIPIASFYTEDDAADYVAWRNSQ